jgi:arsenate reductase-like glutaredoxin family protein
VFKTRPLPTAKTEALDLMLAQPNLIRRPLLVVGKTAIFGFDRVRYDALTRDER